MKMATDSGMGFYPGILLYNPCMDYFQSGPLSSSPALSPVGANTPCGWNSTAGTSLSGNRSPGAVNSTVEVNLISHPCGMKNTILLDPAESSIGGFIDPVPEIKQDFGLAADWSFQEQLILEDGLVKYADEPNIMKYVKIAALLHDKHARDVALRCQWMSKDNGKRHKPECSWNKMNDRKAHLAPCKAPSLADCHFAAPDMEHKRCLPYEGIDGATKHLLDENIQLFHRIAVNLDMFKLQDNIYLLDHAKNNITALLNRMSQMPGIMSQMPLLPVEMDEELANSILPGASQKRMISIPGDVQLKQEHLYRGIS